MVVNKNSKGRAIILFIKSPVAGQVKTRLAEAIGEEAACLLYMNFVSDLLEMLKEVAAEMPYALKLYFYPPSSGKEIVAWLGNEYELIPQQGNDLGEKMRNAFEEVFADGFDSAILIGSDVPDLPGNIIKEGFSLLQEEGAVIGPAHDGGYYLIGFRSDRFLPDAFTGVPWSSNLVLTKTKESFLRNHREFSLLPWQSDIDTVDELGDLRARHEKSGFTSSRTMQYLLKLPFQV